MLTHCPRRDAAERTIELWARRPVKDGEDYGLWAGLRGSKQSCRYADAPARPGFGGSGWFNSVGRRKVGDSIAFECALAALRHTNEWIRAAWRAAAPRCTAGATAERAEGTSTVAPPGLRVKTQPHKSPCRLLRCRHNGRNLRGVNAFACAGYRCDHVVIRPPGHNTRVDIAGARNRGRLYQ